MSRSTRQPTAGTITRAVFSTIIGAKGDEPAITISTSAIDREGDVLDPGGAMLEAYRKNPVVLFAHDHSELPIGSSTSIDVGPSGLRASWSWLQNDERAARVKNAYDQGVLRAASVGFVPIEFEQTDTGYRFSKWELVEWSLCPVPANPEAVRTLKALGLDMVVPIRRLPPSRTSAIRRAAQMLELRTKVGARHSAADLALLQAAHDACAELGAMCTAEHEGDDKHIDLKSIPSDELDITEEEVREIISSILVEQIMQVTGKVGP